MCRHPIRPLLAAALVLPALTWSGHAVAGAEDGEQITTEIIVWLDDHDDAADDELPPPVVDIHLVAADHGITVLDTLVASKGIYLLGAPGDLDEGDIKKLLGKDDRIRYAEPNYEGGSADGNRFHAWPAGPPADNATDLAVDHGIDLSSVHQRATGAGVIVAVLDTGVDAEHPSLQGRVISGWDFIDDDADPDDDASGVDQDQDGLADEAWGHGTHIAGIVAQVAPDAEVRSYRVLDSDGSGRVFAVAAAIFDAVDNGAEVINLSFGLHDRSRSRMLKDAMKYAKKAGVVVVAAAGNDATKHRRYPAAEKDVISVSALDASSDSLAGFSNHGDWVEVAAPGVGVVSTLPDGRVGTWSGSSMAAPFVAGQAAILMERASKREAKHVLSAIRKSSRKVRLDHGVKLKHGAIDILSSLDEID